MGVYSRCWRPIFIWWFVSAVGTSKRFFSGGFMFHDLPLRSLYSTWGWLVQVPRTGIWMGRSHQWIFCVLPMLGFENLQSFKGLRVGRIRPVQHRGTGAFRECQKMSSLGCRHSPQASGGMFDWTKSSVGPWLEDGLGPKLLHPNSHFWLPAPPRTHGRPWYGYAMATSGDVRIRSLEPRWAESAEWLVDVGIASGYLLHSHGKWMKMAHRNRGLPIKNGDFPWLC